MKRIIFLSCFIFFSFLAFSQNALNRSHFELNIGIGRRAYINSHDYKPLINITYSSIISSIPIKILRGMSSVNYVQKINNVFYLKTGYDLNYWDVTYDPATNKGYLLRATSYEHLAHAWFLGGEIAMNKVIFQGGYARYFYFKQLPQYNIKGYTKIGFKYLITKNFYAGFFLKAHSYEADYMDFGLGVKF